MAARPWFIDGLKGWHVLVFFVGFFGVIFCVSGALVWFALTTYPGELPAAYARGVRYNDTIAEAARQDQLGWRVSAGYQAGQLVVSLADSQGRPLKGERVDAEISRPATAHFDRSAALQDDGAGSYAVPITLGPGYWDVAVQVNPDGGGTPYNEKLRLWIGDQP